MYVPAATQCSTEIREKSDHRLAAPLHPTDAQTFLSFLCDYLPSQITEALHRTFRLVWLRFQSGSSATPRYRAFVTAARG
jgi:hypothetical protein